MFPFFWVPEDTIPRRVKANSVPYGVWEKHGHILATEGNVIHYDFIGKFIYVHTVLHQVLTLAVEENYMGVNIADKLIERIKTEP